MAGFPFTGTLEPGAIARVPLPADHGVAPPFGVVATVRVAHGSVTIRCLADDGITIADETRVDASGAPATITLLADVADTALVIANAGEDPSDVAIEGLRCVVVDETDTWTTALSEPRVVPGWSRYYGTLGADLGEKARYRRYLRLAEPLTVTWRDGLRFRIAPSDQLSRVVYVSGTYEPNTMRLLRAWLSCGDTFVDIGANAGVMALAASQWVGREGRVVAVEPSAREFQRLAEHVALNGLAHVTPVRAAVAAAAGRRTLRVAASPRGGLNTLGDRFAYPEMPTAGFEDVEALPLDALLATAGVGPVQAMKIDVEGSETEALDGAAATLAQHRPALVVEVCAAALAASGSSVTALEARLRAARYVLFEIDDATGALYAVDTLSAATDRNIAALPAERADALVARVHSA